MPTRITVNFSQTNITNLPLKCTCKNLYVMFVYFMCTMAFFSYQLFLQRSKLRTYSIFSLRNKENEPVQDKAYNKTCVISKDSDQPVHPCSQISLRWSHMPLTASGLSKEVWMRTPCPTGWIYRLIWVYAGHTGLIVGFVLHWLKYLGEYPSHPSHLWWEKMTTIQSRTETS